MKTMPKWRDEAERLWKDGKATFIELGKKYGVDPSYVRQRAGPDWQAHIIRGLGAAQRRSLNIPHNTKALDMYEARAYLESKQPFSDDIVEGFMADRQFTPVKVFQGGQHKSGVMIECSRKQAPDCLKKAEFFLNTGGKPNPNHVANSFRASGWIVGGGPRADCCPKCYEYSRRALKHDDRQVPAEIVKAPTVLKEDTIVNAPVQPSKLAVVVTLKDIGKAEKRLIDMKLDEVYDIDKGGFQDGWTDVQIAENLSCPVEWVSLVRGEFHGPDTRPEDHSKEIEGLRKLAGEVQEARKLIDIAIDRLSEHDTLVNDRLANFEKLAKEFHDQSNAFFKKVNGAS